jgi:hypothetical protein
MVAKDFFQFARQIFGFVQSDVHALRADGTGLMGGVAREPGAALAELFCESMFEPNASRPREVCNSAFEPWRALARQPFGGVSVSFMTLRIHELDALAILVGELAQIGRFHQLESPSAPVP